MGFFRRDSRRTGAAALDVIGLACILGGVRALSDVTLTAAAGELTGVVGPNGAGKTTLFNVVTGFLPATTGDIKLDGASIVGHSPRGIRRLGLVRTFQNAGGFNTMSVYDNLRVASVSAEKAQVDEIIERFSLAPHLTTAAEECGPATRKTLGIAMALLQEPSVLLLDEPLSGLDPEDRDAVTRTIVDLKATDLTLVVIEHDVDRLLAIADHLVVLDAGVKVAEGSPADLADKPELHDVYLKA